MAGFLCFAVIAIITFLVAMYLSKQIKSISSGYHHTFEGVKFSTQEFYTVVINLVKEKEIPDVKLSTVLHKTEGVFSAKREYLRVEYHEYFFDICAAPFAKDFFVSWRQGELRRMQWGKRQNKTFFEQDTELMFKSSIKLCVDRAIKQMEGVSGMRITEETDLLVGSDTEVLN